MGEDIAAWRDNRPARRPREPQADPSPAWRRGPVRSAFLVPPNVPDEVGHKSGWTRAVVVLRDGARLAYILEFDSFMMLWPRGVPLDAERGYPQYPTSINHTARAHIQSVMQDIADHYGMGERVSREWPWRDPHPYHKGPCKCPGGDDRTEARATG